MLTTFPLRALLGDLDPKQCKLHCAVFNGERHPIDVLATDWAEWVGWNSYRGGRNDFNLKYVFSLAQARDESGVWLFGGVFEVINTWDTYYDVELREGFLPGCIKRLKVAFQHPRNVRLIMDRQVDQMSVVELLREPYSGEPFPGHDSINISLAELGVIYDQDRGDWRGALQYVKGIYVIHDRATGKSYVGCAHGGEGIWSRWGQYVQNCHGGNLDLRRLVKQKGEAYARTNFAFSLLECWPLPTADQHVFDREVFWKAVLDSRRYGHNLN